MDGDKCSENEQTDVTRCLDDQKHQIEVDFGKTIICKFSLTKLKKDCGFSLNELERFSRQSWSNEDKQQLLNKCVDLMLDYHKGLCIAEHFRGILLEILKRTQDLVNRNIEAKWLNHLKFSLTLSHLLPEFPYILSFVLDYFREIGPFFGVRKQLEAKEYVLVVETAYRLLDFSPATFRGLWNWGNICEIKQLRSVEARWYFLKAMSIVLNCNNKEIVELFGCDFNMNVNTCDNLNTSQTNALKEFCFQEENENVDATTKATTTERNFVKSTIRLDDLAEDMPSFHDKTHERSSETTDKNHGDDGEVLNEIIFTENDLSDGHMITANMLFQRISKSRVLSNELVEVPSMLRNVEALSVAFVSGKGVLLSGAVGSGKTSLVEHFASLTGREKAPYLYKVQLGDQTDSKALIGSYCCSDVPGEFLWRPGVLTRAVREGRWLLLEDIDCAPMDVISVLIPLLESRVLSIPGKGNIQATPGFQLFATQRIGRVNRGFKSESSMLEHLWSKVDIEPLTKGELEEIVVAKFPNLASLSNKLVDTFSLLSSDLQLNSKPDTRSPSLSADQRLSTVRDFMKWCRRLNALSNAGPTLLASHDIFQEAMDCFCATISNLDNRMSLALAIGAKLNINKVKVEFVCSIYKPAVNVAPLCFTVGRITLNREPLDESVEKPSFAFTRHSLTLLESLAVCVSQTEPVLLVGETGTGKTSAIQYLASLCNRALIVVNMSQQSDSTDLIGGFKPMEMKQLVAPVREEFEKLFCRTFSRKQNVQFLANVQQCFGKRQWEVLFKVILHALKAALERLSKDISTGDTNLISLWKKVGQRIQRLRQQLKQAESTQAFSFVEGALVKAIKRGDWVLLDEINLATPETLECLNGILESQEGSVVVLERGDAEPIVRHEEFRMFACMNPANDVGKKDLPAGIRNRFTEIFVNELQDVSDLKTLVFSYLQGLSPTSALVDGVVSFYLVIREEACRKLTDGSSNRPYYSLRTLCRALKYASRNPHGNILRSVYEGFCISFLTQLDRSSHNVVENLLQEKLLGRVNGRSLVNQPLRKPVLQSEKFLNFEGYWVCQGNLEPTRSSEYVFTSSVKDNLKCLARIVSGRNFPVLIQGETSVGKTSLINWLAKASGNYCVRINNHEHTDIQEYLGCYTSDSTGKLVFKEGILVDAMRKGYWIILDELNLAPTDVLEALNRLLDDNRELFIPEIQETVKAHTKFMLFATQNPPGHYGGRKVLSRAFRNRFVELHFEELPSKELETILHKRCSLPMSYSKTLVNIMLELQVRRRGSTVFSGKQGYITLRDLFRWADRYSRSQENEGTFFDWNQQLAEDGYFLLAGRCRNGQESLVVQEVIEKHMKRKIDVNCLFGHPSTTKLTSFSEKILSELINNCPQEFGHVVFTYNMRRLAILVARALQFNEPVLLVGETGCGKTTICQVFSAVHKRKLYAVNCHLHTETSDFLGGLRPARRDKNNDKDTPLRLFEWCDGSLVVAMKEGGMFLADEISLADDSVLERLNSVLEPERTLILAEKGSNSDSEFEQDIDLIVAERGFQLLATMNPGGDYGKKELSPALRNRFTEIWCPANDNPADMIAIIEHNVSPGITLKPQPDGSSGIGNAMIEFIEWFKQNNFAKRSIVTVRDFLSWVQFINVCSSKDTADKHTLLEPPHAYFHGAFLVFLDALGLGTTIHSKTTSSARDVCLKFLRDQLKDVLGVVNGFGENAQDEAMETEDEKNEVFTFGGFSIPRGSELSLNLHNQYALNAPTTAGNAERVMRAMQLHRPILLEGSPGVGKTSLVSALAKVSGHRLVRINLSEQTDISDLFGADLPVEGGQGCQFSWCDGPLLLALKSGSWIVLDELNLASQSVLEGLNACFDHRGEIFIPELGMSFQVQHERTKFFACQNPLNQGGGRKGLPKSFLNRFTQVYVEPLTHDDLLFITHAMYPSIDRIMLEKMITFNAKVYQHCIVEGLCSKQGGSWEFNLRDIFRWCDLMLKYQDVSHWNPVAFVHLIYAGRMRTDVCRNQIWELCSTVFGENLARYVATLVHATPENIQVGHCVFPKCKSHMEDGTFQTGPLYILHRNLKPLESLLTCLKMNWLAILVGPKSCCKTSLARLSAQLTGTKLDVMAMNSSIDTTELLGGYEQVDLERQWTDVKQKTKDEMFRLCRSLLLSKKFDDTFDDFKHMLNQWFMFCEGNPNSGLSDPEDEAHAPAMLDNISQFSKVIDEAINVCQRHNLTDYNFERLKVLVEELHKDLIQCNGSSRVSGQFQWVDGQLVKALKDGHWLLIDNVNFCSPSVLDRLNGLLEPGGVLSINERGVVDGEIPVINPHPDFRLIFAMDSKYGEISRAMRNRGVDIFMTNEECDNHDLGSMLCASGCRDSTVIQSLANFHNKNKEDSLLQTIHAGSLINKLWQRGVALERLFPMSVNHVYGQIPDFRQFKAEEESGVVFSQLLKHEKQYAATTFQKDAIGAMVFRHALPLERTVKDSSTSLKDIRTAINIFLEWSSKEDWHSRLHLLKSYLFSNKKQGDRFTSELNEADYCIQRLFNSSLSNQLYNLYEYLETKCKDFLDCEFDARYQPFNIRVNGLLYESISCKMHCGGEVLSQLSSYTNRVHLLWTFLTFEARMKSYLNSVDKINLETPLLLSLAYTRREIRSENLPHQGIAHIYPLLHSFQECVRTFLENREHFIKDAVAYMIWVALKQYKHFLEVCTRSYSNGEDYHVLFDLHWKFFNNGALETLCKILNDFGCKIAVEKLMSVRKCFDEICKCDNELSVHHWKMINNFEHPTVFVFEEMCVLWKKLTKIYTGLVNHNTKIKFQVEPSVNQIHAWQITLLKDMVSLIELREGKVREEKTQNILTSIKENANKIELAHRCDDVMDQSSSDIHAQFSDISIRSQDGEDTENFAEVFTCEVVQSYYNFVANCAYMECINALKLVSLHKKIVDRTTFLYSRTKWKEMLTSHCIFCVKYLCKIPLNIAVIQYFLQSVSEVTHTKRSVEEANAIIDILTITSFASLNERCKQPNLSICFDYHREETAHPNLSTSVLRLADDNAFCDWAEFKSQEGNVESAVTFSLQNLNCFVKTFGALSFSPQPQCSSNHKDNDRIQLVDVDIKIAEYNHLTTFLWLHQNYFANLECTQLSVDWKSMLLAFIRVLHCLNTIKECPDSQQLYNDLLGFSSEAPQISKDLCQSLKKKICDIQETYCWSSSIQNDGICLSKVFEYLGTMAETGVDKAIDNSTKFERNIHRGACWVFLGMIQSTILRPVGNIDPVEEANVKVDNIKHEILDLSCELNVRSKNEEILTGVAISEDSAPATLQVNSSHVGNLVQYRVSLESELSKVGDEVAYRPVPSQFQKISGILQHFTTSVGNYSDSITIINNLCSSVLHDSVDVKESSAEVRRDLVHLKTWTKSVRKFILQLSDYVAYQDVLGPYISGLLQIEQGSKMIISAVESQLKLKEFTEKIKRIKLNIKASLPQEIVSLVQAFSNTGNSMSVRIRSLLSEEMSDGIEVLCQSRSSMVIDSKEESERLKSRMRMLALNILKRSISRTGYTKPDDILILKDAMNCYKELWSQREQQRKLREEEDDSLYKFKTKTYCGDETEEEHNQKEIEELFTSFDQEYKDVSLENSSSGKKQEFGEIIDGILETDMAKICKIHHFVVSSAPNISQVLTTLDNTQWKENDVRLEDVALESYNIAAQVVNIAHLSDDELLKDTTQTHLLMSSLLLKSLSSCSSESTSKDHTGMWPQSALFGNRSEEYDIYHDSNLKEIIQVLPILTSFKSRLHQLLEEWPDHPTLVQLCLTIDRIISFPVTSPVMKILNGLEILLQHSQEWESNASRHVSVRNHLDQITQLIINWKKLELSCWSSLLRVCENKVREKANHWWFHLHDVIQEYCEHEDDRSTDFSELITVLQQFLESSSLGEFSERLKILATLCSQKMVEDAHNANSDTAQTILWNTYCYYKQFESRVESLIQKAKTPIEKDLKDFIKIVKWKDINYWAMKETSAKSHYTLLKFMKKYKTALSEGIDGVLISAREVMSFEDTTGQDDSCWKLQPDHFLSPLHFKNLEMKDTDNDSQHLTQIFSRMRKLTQEKLKVSRYEILSASVNRLTGEIVGTTHSLQKLEVGDKTGKERTQFRKHIHVLKKRALADLFKILRKIGLSYRKGVTLRQQNSLKDPMMVDCCDVSKRLKNIDKLFDKKENPNFLPILETSMKYYQKSVARSAILNNVLPSPSKELTVGDVDRIKGFAEHLRQITQRQRENISTVGKSFSELILVTRQLTGLAVGSSCRLPPQKQVAEWTLKLSELLDDSLEISENVLCLLETCPESKIDLTMSPVPEHLSELSKCCKQDNTYVRAKDGIKTFYEEVSNIKSQVYLQTLMLYQASNAGEKENDVFITTWFHFESLKSSFKQLREIVRYLDEFVKMDRRSGLSKECTLSSDLGVGKLPFHLREKISKTCNEFADWSEKTFVQTQSDNTEEQFSSLHSKVTSTRDNILLSFQKWYKRRESEIGKAKEENDEEDLLNEKYFVEKLDNELLEDISLLNIEERTKDIKSFIKFFRQAIDAHYEKHHSSSVQTLCEIMTSILPCLSQYVLVVEYHFHQLLVCHRNSCKLHSVLLGIFAELLQKGFCLPPDDDGALDGEGATSFEDAENCGIGEGEGRKDVSDQIEDEEQLLGAEQKEKEEENKNEIADEEHGIEMSEDFEGETQDVEKSGESEDEDGESGDEDKNDLEEQMGDVDGADETLDEKLWADSGDEDGDDDKDTEANERGTGTEGEEQSEIVAKEENQGSSKENQSKPKEDRMDEDKINELAKDEDDLGNLDDNFTDNRNELMPDDLQPEDMKLADDLELDAQEDDGGESEDDDGKVGDGDDAFGDEDDKDDDNDTDEVNNDENEHVDESDIEMKENRETGEEMSKEDEQNKEEDQADLEKDDDENKAKEIDWKTESETKGNNVESIDDQGKPDASSGAAAGDERPDPTANDESMAEGDNEGTGNSISQQSRLDSTDSSSSCKTTDLASNDTSFYRKQLNKSRADRSLGSSEETAQKKSKVLESSEDSSTNNQRQEPSTSADLFEHMRNQDEMHDAQVYDAATAEQQQEQEAVKYPTEGHDQAENMDEDWDLPPEDTSGAADQKEEKFERGMRFQSDKTQAGQEKEIDEVKMSTEEEIQAREEWQDTRSSLFIGKDPSLVEENTVVLDLEKCRCELEELLCKWRDLKEGSPEEQVTALDTWHRYEQLTSAHSQQLCEQLRIVLEPSIANKLRGDYRTGKRLNMRKVIPYIASQYRKDKIWLRRTKKSKRQYQILLAIDDSSSMSDNKSKQLAFESLAVITNALTRLEAGEIAICSFGEEVQLLHPFHETFTEQSGANILRQFRFEQKKTKIAQLLDSCSSVMTSARSRVNTGNDVSQLLLIVSDGRGIFLEGVETVQRAVRRAREAGIFLVFVIIDNPTNKDSILDIKVPLFRPDQLPELKCYIEQFPFPFYIVLRDISSLPETLSDSLRQWFELVTNMT